MRTFWISFFSFMFGVFCADWSHGHRDGQKKADTVYICDTIRIPEVRDSVRVRTVLRHLRSVDTVRATDTITTVQRESVMVEVPLIQKHYEGEGYSAWVSGYEPRLDSIALRHRTVIERQTVKVDKRWGFGLGAGLGVGSKGVGVGVGFGFFYKLW